MSKNFEKKVLNDIKGSKIPPQNTPVGNDQKVVSSPQEPTSKKEVKVQYREFNIDSLKESIKNSNEWRYKQRLERDYKNLAVTDLSTCIRQLFYRFNHYECDIQKATSYLCGNMMADAGTSVHKYIQSVFRFSETERNLEINTGKIVVKGRIDAIDKYRNLFNIVEIKTCDTEEFHDPNFLYKQEAFNQVSFYAYYFTKIANTKVNNVKLLYVPRSLKDFRLWVLPVDDLVIQKGENQIELANTLADHLKNNTVPDIDNPFVMKDQCLFCGYQNTVCEKNLHNKIEVKPIQKVENKQPDGNVKKNIIIDKSLISKKIIDLR